MNVKRLIELLQRADPDAEVFWEYEGELMEIEDSEVRIGIAHHVALPSNRGATYWNAGRYAESHFAQKPGYPLLREAPAVVLNADDSKHAPDNWEKLNKEDPK